MKKMLVVLAALAILAMSSLAMAAQPPTTANVTVNLTIDQAVGITASETPIPLVLSGLTDLAVTANGTVTVAANCPWTLTQSADVVRNAGTGTVTFSCLLDSYTGNVPGRTITAHYTATRSDAVAVPAGSYTGTFVWTVSI